MERLLLQIPYNKRAFIIANNMARYVWRTTAVEIEVTIEIIDDRPYIIIQSVHAQNEVTWDMVIDWMSDEDDDSDDEVSFEDSE